jgi:hypothetical protein
MIIHQEKNVLQHHAERTRRFMLITAVLFTSTKTSYLFYLIMSIPGASRSPIQIPLTP